MQFQDKEFNQFLSRILFSSYYRGFQPFLLRCLRFSRSIFIKKNRILLFNLQISAAKNLSGCYKAIQEGKKEAKRLKNKLRGKINKEDKLKLKKNLENIQIRIFTHRNIARITKTIIDGVVWRNIRFDRAILRYMASNRITGFLDINDPGFRGVLSVAKYFIWQRKSTVIINDITNFLRIGDLTEISKKGIFLHESKAKGRKVKNIFSLLQDIKKTSKISKQSERLLKIQTAISHRKIFISDNKIINIKDIKVPFKNYLKNIKKIILKAKREGYFSKKISDYLVVSCLDLIKSVQLNQKGKINDLKDFKTAENWEEKDFIISFSNTDFFYKNEDFFIPNMTPYSVFPFSSKICLELLSGSLILTARLNISKVFSYFEENNWEVDAISVDEFIKRGNKTGSLYPDIYEAYNYDETLCILKRDKFSLCIPATKIFRIGMDFMAAETILMEAEEVFRKAIPFKDGICALNIKGERKIWK